MTPTIPIIVSIICFIVFFALGVWTAEGLKFLLLR